MEKAIKEIMTPAKKKLLSDVYDVRLRNFAKNPEEIHLRQKKLNKLIKDAFANITKSEKTKETLRVVTLE